MSIDDTIRKLDAAAAEIRQGAEQRSLVAAKDMVALISNRVIQKGTDSDGQPFSPYSDHPLDPRKLFGKSRSSGAEQRVRKAIRGGLISYKTFRQLNNLNVDKKNFEFTGEMWRKFDVKSTTSDGGNIIVTIGGTTPASALKIDYLSEQENQSIIAPSGDEVRTIERIIGAWIDGIIKKHLA